MYKTKHFVRVFADNEAANIPIFCLSLLIFISSMFLYFMTLAPTVTGEDSGELISAAYGGGVAHPPGYPLWTMLTGVFIKVFPFGPVAYRANLFSAVLAALSGVVLFRILVTFFSIRPLVAAAGSICFSCGKHLWSQAVITEVYTLQILLTCMALYYALRWKQSGKNVHLYILALIAGLALGNHHLTVLLIPVLFIFVLVCRPRTFINAKIVVLCIVFFAIGLLPYLYLPLAAGRHPYINWGSPDTWQGFFDHVLRRQYDDKTMHTAHSLSRILMHLKKLWEWNYQQYSVYAVPFMLAGIISLARRHRGLLLFTLGFFLMHTVIFAEILNFSSERQDLFCTRVFMLPAYIITAIWLTVGCQNIWQKIMPKINKLVISEILVTLPMAVILLITISSNYKENDMSKYYYAEDHADNILNSLEQNAILVPSGDHNTFPVIYRHYVEGLRPDVVIADKYGYIEYDLYKDMPNAPRRIKTRQEREQIEAYIIRNSGRPVYFTIRPPLDLLDEYKAVSCGMLFIITKKEQVIADMALPVYRYRNLENTGTVMDHAASVIVSDYYFYLASNALHQKNVQLALENIQKAAELSTGLKEEMNNLATLLAEFGQDEQAIIYYEKAARLDSSYLTPRWNLANLFKANGDILHAIQVFNDLARLTPDDYRIFGELGFLLYQYGDINLATQNWGKSLSLNPNQPQIIEALGNLTNGQGKEANSL